MTITSAIEGVVIAAVERQWLQQSAKLHSLTNPATGGPVGGYAYQHAEAYLYESLFNQALVWIAAREGVETHPLATPEPDEAPSDDHVRAILRELGWVVSW